MTLSHPPGPSVCWKKAVLYAPNSIIVPARASIPKNTAKYLNGDLIVLYDRIATIGPGTNAKMAPTE